MSFITRKEAATKIEAIINQNKPVKTGQTIPIRKTTFNVYSIPIDYLAPNVLNDRIAWKIRQFEAEYNRKLDKDNEIDVNYIYDLIYDESEKENEKTLKDLAENGQQIDGIITKDGVIIDGNRRATLLRKLFLGEANRFNHNISDFSSFNAIVLSDDISDRDIMLLETQLQIGADEKVKYNPICMYIKIDNLSKADYNEQQIANSMGIKPSEVKEKKEVFALMNEYLDAINKPNHYTLLEGLEDQFINTKTIFKKLDNGSYSTYDWGDENYTEEDVTNFKQVCYDYMRAKFEGKKYRDILLGKPNKSNGVFVKESVWKKFFNNHENIIEKHNPQNEKDWELLGKKQFAANLKYASDQLEEVKNDINVSSLCNTILSKVNSLSEYYDNGSKLVDEDFKNLKEANSLIYQITKDYK